MGLGFCDRMPMLDWERWAPEVVKGNETLVLCDDKGVPVWTPHG
jgi:hypothetical protein